MTLKLEYTIYMDKLDIEHRPLFCRDPNAGGIREQLQFEVTPTGQVWSILGNVYRKPVDNGEGLLLFIRGYASTYRPKSNNPNAQVNRLVAQTYIPNTDPVHKIIVKHLDGDYRNNNVENLKWMTVAESMSYSKRLREGVA